MIKMIKKWFDKGSNKEQRPIRAASGTRINSRFSDEAVSFSQSVMADYYSSHTVGATARAIVVAILVAILVAGVTAAEVVINLRFFI